MLLHSTLLSPKTQNVFSHQLPFPLNNGFSLRRLKGSIMDGSCHHLFFSSGMADVALWLGPYMSISSQNDICTRTQKVQKCRQITTNQKPHKTPRRPANPPARFAFRQKQKQQTRHTKGQEPKQKHPQKGFAKGHSGLTTVSHSKTCQN